MCPERGRDISPFLFALAVTRLSKSTSDLCHVKMLLQKRSDQNEKFFQIFSKIEISDNITCCYIFTATFCRRNFLICVYM